MYAIAADFIGRLCDPNRVTEQPAGASPTTERVLITGGAGFLGINLARHLLGHGYRVRSFDRAPFDYPEAAQVEVITGDIRDLPALSSAMEGVDYVVHTAAALPLYSPSDIMTTDVNGTENVLEAARRAGVKRVVHISSTAVYGIPDHHPLLEDDALQGVGPYGIAKIRAEAACLRYRAEGMVVPILRPKSFVGPERLGVFAILYDWAQEGRNFPLLGNGRNRYQLLDVEDLCDAIRLCLTGPSERVNDTFNVGAKEFTNMREDYQAVLDAAGHGKHIRCFPAMPVIWALRLLELLRLSPLYKWVYETASKDSFVSIDKAVRQLGYSPRYSNRDALVRNYRWYTESYVARPAEAGVTHRVPWKQGALGIIKRLF